MLDSKNSAIKDLQYELARVCKVNDLFCIEKMFPQLLLGCNGRTDRASETERT